MPPADPRAPTVLLLPGWQDSGPQHWQSAWERRHGCLRVVQHDWMRPLRGDWIARLEEVVLDLPGSGRRDIVLAAHSLGCLLTAAWAARTSQAARIRGALLVAPGDPQLPHLAGALHSWSPVELSRLPFPSVLVASQDDPYCSLARARSFAQAWGARFVDYGRRGHVNSDSGLGDWDEGWQMLCALAQATPIEE